MRNGLTVFLLVLLLGFTSLRAQTPPPDALVLTTIPAFVDDALPPAATQTGTLVNDAAPVVVEIPEGGADVTDTGDVIVIVQKQDEGKNVVIVGLFALVLVLVAVVVWQADRLRVMIPAPLVPVLEKGADAALEFGDKVAKGTPTGVDDSVLDLIRDLKVSFFEALRRTPPATEAATTTPPTLVEVPTGTDGGGG